MPRDASPCERGSEPAETIHDALARHVISVQPTACAARGIPHRSATCPYVMMRPRGMERTMA